MPTINSNPLSGAFVASVDSVVLHSNSLESAVFYLFSDLSQVAFLAFHHLYAALLLNIHNHPVQFLVVAGIICSPRFLDSFAEEPEEVIC